MQLIGTLFWIIREILNLYMWCFVISAVLSWLVAFNVINMNNRFIYTIDDFLYRITEPLLRPIRNFLPNFGGIDFSPLIAIFGIILVKDGVIPQIFIWMAG